MWCPVVWRRPQHAVSKLACLVLSSADLVAPVIVQAVSTWLGCYISCCLLGVGPTGSPFQETAPLYTIK